MEPCFPGDGWTPAYQWELVNEFLVWLCLRAQLLLYLLNCLYLNPWVFSLLLFWLSPPSHCEGVSKWLCGPSCWLRLNHDNKVGFRKTRISVVLAPKRGREWRSMSPKYKGMETLLGEGIKLEDILVIHETLIEQHTEKHQVKNVGFLQSGEKMRQISISRAQVHGSDYVQ